MISRRRFLQTIAASGAGLTLSPADLLGGLRKTNVSYFGVHPFIASHPSAVFVMRTNVDVKTNSAAIKQVGMDFGQSVFVPMTSPGIPISHRVAVKPNIVMMPARDDRYLGIVTDANFVEGVIESIKSLGLSGSQFYLREVNSPEHFSNSGYADMALRTGANLKPLSSPVDALPAEDVQWMDVPEGKWFSRIPFLWPVNAPDTWLLNISKFKTHLMGMTLCAKNIQGAIAAPYVEHCKHFGESWDISADHVQTGSSEAIVTSYNTHLARRVPRWDRPGDEGGLWQETWATRCLDNNSVTRSGLNIVEAVYGREGPFIDGPGPDGYAADHMTNMVIFGINPFHVDNVAHWLGGHEPGNFGLFHLAIERGQSQFLNPMDVPVYEWKADGTAIPAPLTSFPRYELKTLYLRRDYNGQTEPLWHLVNEPYDYTTTGVRSQPSEIPQEYILHQNFPNPFNPATTIEFSVPRDADIRLEVFNVSGELIDVLVDGHVHSGSHLVAWDGTRKASGVYFCRLSANGVRITKRMVLLR